MINQIPNIPADPQNMTPVAPIPAKQSLPNNIKSLFIQLFNKIYSNKRLFWLICGLFGIMFLIIILGLIFGKKQPSTEIVVKPTGTPFILKTPTASVSADIVGTSAEKLNKLKGQIDNLDVKQNRLKPPTLYFDIKF